MQAGDGEVRRGDFRRPADPEHAGGQGSIDPQQGVVRLSVGVDQGRAVDGDSVVGGAAAVEWEQGGEKCVAYCMSRGKPPAGEAASI